jgi:hypothetical protein
VFIKLTTVVLFDRLRLTSFDRRHTMIRSLAMVLVVLVLFAFGSAHASLINNDNNLIYDTDLNITWYNPSITNMTWNQAMSWTANLTIGGVTDWRLPTALNADGSAPSSGYYRVGSELGHLYYESLGNTAYGPLLNTGPFANLQPVNYWTNTEWASFTDNAWAFSFADGLLGFADKSPNSTYIIYYSAMAVHSGNVGGASQTPIPGTILLLLPGFASVVAMKQWLKNVSLHKPKDGNESQS